MAELIELRNMLMNELNVGLFDSDSWNAAVIMAKDLNCLSIQAQLERYISHYGWMQKTFDYRTQ
jgi:FMN-dependent NADH-azoreductase